VAVTTCGQMFVKCLSAPPVSPRGLQVACPVYGGISAVSLDFKPYLRDLRLWRGSCLPPLSDVAEESAGIRRFGLLRFCLEIQGYAAVAVENSRAAVGLVDCKCAFFLEFKCSAVRRERM
jgi:hypothetical protein